MTDERYQKIMADLGMPNSRSLLQALQQVANEVEQATRAAERERCAKLCEPTNPRQCDCERCDCGNATDARMVAEWDEAAALAKRIRGA